MEKIQLLKFEGDVNGVEVVLFKQGDVYTVTHKVDPAVGESRSPKDFAHRMNAYRYAETLIVEELTNELFDADQ